MEEYVLLPVRCTCNFVLDNKRDAFQELLKEGKTPEEALNILQINRSCCRIKLLEPIVLPRSTYNRPDLLEPQVFAFFEK